MTTAFVNGIIFTGKEIICGKALIVEHEKIQGMLPAESIAEGAKIIDCENCFIAPGLIDLQIYGGGGYLFSNNPSSAALHAMIDSLVASGTTGFMLTLATNSIQIFREAIQVVKENPHPSLLGLHFEGPYINPVKRGAHLIEYIKRPEKNEVEELLKEAEGTLKMMTIAPEMCDPEIIQLLKDNGVLISAGHSNATFEEANEGFKNGIAATTHLFNAMSPFHHRDTGLPGATYLNENVSASIIADGIHTDFNTVSISKKIMKERLFLITDAVEENMHGAYVHVKQKDRFTLPDGTLSGSCLSLLQAVKNCVNHVGIPLEEALRMASTYPAKLIHSTNTGKIEAGCRADLVIFTNDFLVKYVMVNGRIMNDENAKRN